MADRFADRDDRSITGLGLSEPTRLILTVLLVFGFIFALVARPLYDTQFNLREGDKATELVYAPLPLSIVNPVETEKARIKARDGSPRIYVLDTEAAQRAAETLERLLAIGAELKQSASAETTDSDDTPLTSQLAELVRRQMGVNLSADATSVALQIAGNEVAQRRISEIIGRLLSDRWVTDAQQDMEHFARLGIGKIILSDSEATLDKAEPLAFTQIREKALAHSRLDFEIEQAISDIQLAQQLGVDRDGLVDLLLPLVPSNVLRDRTLERAARAKLQRQVRPVVVTFDTGDAILAPGERVDKFTASVLQTFNQKKRLNNAYQMAFLAFLIGLMMAFIRYYVGRFHRDFTMTPANIITLAFPLMFPLLIGRILLLMFGASPPFVYAFPAALIGLLGVLLVEARYSLTVVVWGAVLYCLAIGSENQQTFSVFLVMLLSGGIAISSTFSLRMRRDALLAGGKAGLAAALGVLGVGWHQGAVDPGWTSALAALTGGIVSGILLYPSVYFLEKLAGVTTDLRLMELTTIRHPLIRKLEDRAPGTYQHTLNVSKLAEAAAISIGANDILVRAGVLFHDIGKMDKPKYFSENQVTPDDRKSHDKLTPNMSALIIKEHVRNGIIKARKAGLPKRIIDFIPEHHGTTTIAYFLHKAQKQYEESESNDPVNPEDFRHVGPKPQTVETAIVLLADSVEAVASAKFSGASVDRDQIRRVVRDVINQKFREEQFDECSLTLRELSLITDAFVRTLEGRFHFRVSYPGGDGKKKGGNGAGGGTGKRQAVDASQTNAPISGEFSQVSGSGTGKRQSVRSRTGEE
jgi:putative nucleotidyltransferase with HDIG domain